MADLSRRATVHVDQRWLMQMLELPEDVEIVTIKAEQDPVGFYVVVTKPDLPVVDEWSQAPIVHRHVTVEGDERTVTWTWPTEEAADTTGGMG